MYKKLLLAFEILLITELPLQLFYMQNGCSYLHLSQKSICTLSFVLIKPQESEHNNSLSFLDAVKLQNGNISFHLRKYSEDKEDQLLEEINISSLGILKTIRMMEQLFANEIRISFITLNNKVRNEPVCIIQKRWNFELWIWLNYLWKWTLRRLCKNVMFISTSKSSHKPPCSNSAPT